MPRPSTSRRRAQSFVLELAARTERLPADDPERQVEALRQFQKVAVFKVALADLTGRLPLMKVSDRLTDIAELIVQCCMDLAWQQMTRGLRHPVLRRRGGDICARCAVAVAGYGKLGGLELGYGSDLDLVFLHDSSGEFQQTQGDAPARQRRVLPAPGTAHRAFAHHAFGGRPAVRGRYAPAAERQGRIPHDGHRCLRALSAARTRGPGNTRRCCARAPWRAMRICCAAFEAARRRMLCARRAPRHLARPTCAEMRLRMRRELSKAGAGQFDIKQDAGGIADIEFLVQYWVLAAANAHPELLTYTDNIRQLEGLAAVGVLDGRRRNG